MRVIRLFEQPTRRFVFLKFNVLKFAVVISHTQKKQLFDLKHFTARISNPTLENDETRLCSYRPSRAINHLFARSSFNFPARQYFFNQKKKNEMPFGLKRNVVALFRSRKMSPRCSSSTQHVCGHVTSISISMPYSMS